MTPAHDLGRRLREAREARGWTVSDVAATTKISARALTSIEREAFDDLPDGIFRRAYVRAYATEVGLDGEALARAYVTRFEPPPAPPAPRRRRWGPALRLTGGILALSGIAVAAIAVRAHLRAPRADAGLEPADPEPALITPAQVPADAETVAPDPPSGDESI
jgi:transcriptional regulator with XRE-family HTH domain